MTDIASLNIKIDTSDAKTAKNDLDKMTNAGKTAESQMGSMSNAAVKLGKALAAAFSVYKIIEFVTQIKNAGVELDSLKRSYDAITGSQRLAGAEMQYINDTAKKLGLNLTSLESNYKGILAASKGTVLEGENTRKIFSAVANASSVLGLSADSTTGILRALEQMMSKGNVQAEELRGQLGERIPGAFGMAAEAMGVTTQKLNDMLQKGEVLASDLLPKLADVLENRYGTAAQSAGESSRAAFENFNTAVLELKRSLAESGILEYLAKVTRNATDMINGVRSAIDSINADKAKTSIAEYDAAIEKANANFAQFKSLWGNDRGLVPENLKSQFDNLSGAVETLESARDKLARGLQNEQGMVSTFGKAASEASKAAAAAAAAAAALEEKLRKEYAKTTDYRLAEAKKELAAYVKIEGAKPEYVAMLKDEIASLEKKANATSIAEQKKVIAAHNKALEEQVRAFEQAKEEQKRALEAFNDDYKKATLSPFEYEVEKLDEMYKEREKLVKAGLITEWQLHEWYADEFFKLNEEDVTRFIDTQEKKAAAQRKIEEEKIKLEKEASEEAAKKQQEAIDAAQEAYDDLYDGIYGFTREVIDDVDNMGDTLVKMAEDMVKDIIAAFVTQKIAIPIYMYAADLAGISTGLASGMSPSSGGLASMTSPISSLFTIGKTAYTLVTEGVSAAVSDLVGADLLGSISSAMFGETASTILGETAATTFMPTYTSIYPTVEYAATEGVSDLALAGTEFGTGTAPTTGAGIGAAGAIGLAAAAFMAIDQFLGSHDKADPDIYVQSPTGGLTEATATYTISNRDAVTDEIVAIFDAAFASLDESLDANIVDAVTASAFRGKARITDLDETDANALINSLVESAFSGDYTGAVFSLDGLFGQGGMDNNTIKSDGEYMTYFNNMVTGFTKGLDGTYSKGLSDILMEAIGLDSGIFDFEFLKSLQAEGENLFDTFANFAIVVQETDGFVENITRQMNDFGFTVEEAFTNILVVISVLDEMQASADALTTVTAITTLKQLTESWYALIDSLEAAYATTSQISEAESTMATVLGANITGLTADALQSALSGGGDIESILQTSIQNAAYADIAQKIAEEYISGINNQIGQVWLDTDGDLQAVVEAMQNIDTTEAQKAIADLKESFGLLSDTAEEQAELLAAAAAKRRELSIDILYAQGEAEQALAMEREDIINELIETYGSESDAIIDLQKQLWALTDAADAAKELMEDLLSVVEDARSNYETALNTALSAAKSEYEALVESFKSAEYQLNTVRAAHIKEQKTLLQEQTDAYSESIADLTDELKELESIAANLKEYREGLLLSDDSPLLPGEMLAEAKRQFAIAGPENLVDASQNLLSAGRGAMTDYKEYAKLFDTVQSRVSGAEADVKTQSQALQEQIDMASVQVELLNAEIELMSETSETLMSMEQAEAEYYAAKLALDNSSFEEDIAFYEKELDRLAEINGSVLSLNQATKNYQSALISAISQGYRNLEYNFQSELNELKDSRGIGASFADGGIISGPESGYNVITQFHGTEMIIPESKFDSIKSDKESDEEIKSLLRTLISKVSEDSQHNKKIHRILDRADAGKGSILVRTV